MSRCGIGSEWLMTLNRVHLVGELTRKPVQIKEKKKNSQRIYAMFIITLFPLAVNIYLFHTCANIKNTLLLYK